MGDITEQLTHTYELLSGAQRTGAAEPARTGIGILLDIEDELSVAQRSDLVFQLGVYSGYPRALQPEEIR